MHNIITYVLKPFGIAIAGLLSMAGYNFTTPTIVPNTDGLQKQVQTLETKVNALSSSQILGGYQPSGGSNYKLANSISSTATSINLTSFKEPISNIPYTMSYLNSDFGFATLEPNIPTKSEYVKFTGITQNTNGSATITGVTRGLPRSNTNAGCTASTTLSLSHTAQSDFAFTTDSPCFFQEYAVKRNDETITGSWTVPTPLVGGNPTTKTYVDALVNGGAVSYNQITAAGTAGETVSAGQAVYLKQADGRWYKAASTIAEASSTILAIAQGSGTSGNPVTNGVLLSGLDSNQSGLTAGVNYFLSTTAGTIGTATTTRIVGRARTSTSIYFNTSFITDGLFTVGNTYTGNNTYTGTNIFSSINNSTFTGTSTLASTTILNASPMLLIASSTATTTTSRLNIPYFTSRSTHIRVVVYETAVTDLNHRLRIQFNGDTGNNYSSPPNATAGAFIDVDQFNSGGTASNIRFFTYDIVNVLNKSKYLMGTGRNPDAFANATSTTALWANTTAQISSLQLSESATGDIGTGSYVYIYATPY